jgi:hypothetical protein
MLKQLTDHSFTNCICLHQVRAGFRAHAGEPDQKQIGKLLRDAESRLSYLKIVTPRDARGQEGIIRKIYQDGRALEEGDAPKKGRAPISNWTGANMDPDSVSRHDHSLKRARFKNNSDVIGPLGF